MFCIYISPYCIIYIIYCSFKSSIDFITFNLIDFSTCSFLGDISYVLEWNVFPVSNMCCEPPRTSLSGIGREGNQMTKMKPVRFLAEMVLHVFFLMYCLCFFLTFSVDTGPSENNSLMKLLVNEAWLLTCLEMIMSHGYPKCAWGSIWSACCWRAKSSKVLWQRVSLLVAFPFSLAICTVVLVRWLSVAHFWVQIWCFDNFLTTMWPATT